MMVARLSQETKTRPSDHFADLMDLDMTPAEALILDIFSIGTLAMHDGAKPSTKSDLGDEIQQEWSVKDAEYKARMAAESREPNKPREVIS